MRKNIIVTPISAAMHKMLANCDDYASHASKTFWLAVIPVVACCKEKNNEYFASYMESVAGRVDGHRCWFIGLMYEHGKSTVPCVVFSCDVSISETSRI